MTSCPYGKMFLPRGAAFSSTGGLYLLIQDDSNNYTSSFIHAQDVYLESGEKFVTVTENIDTHITPKKLTIYYNLPINIENFIRVTIKNKNTKKVIASKYFGKANEQTTYQHLDFSSPFIIDLYNDSIILEIESVDWLDTDPCCDRLPSQIIISDLPREVGGSRFLCIPLEQYYELPSLNGTTTPEPFIIGFLIQPSDRSVELNNYTTVTFSATSTNDIDFSYWFEVSKNNGQSWAKISRIMHGKSNVINTLPIHVTSEKNGYKYRAVIVEPKILQSNIATLSIIFPTTTTTTPEPCIAVPTTTTEPPYYSYYIESETDIEKDIEI